MSKFQPVALEEVQARFPEYVTGVYPHNSCLISRDGELVAALMGIEVFLAMMEALLAYWRAQKGPQEDVTVN